MRRALPTLLAAAVALVATPSARGYELMKSKSGEDAHWERVCLDWWFWIDGESDLPYATLESELGASFQLWSDVPTAYPQFRERGALCDSGIGVESFPGPRNVVVLRDAPGSWEHPTRVVGLTSVTIDDASGRIVDADIELNGVSQHLTIDGSPTGYDLRSVANHEIGHVLGLEHTPVYEAVMYFQSEPGQVFRRELHPDDVAGVTANHPLEASPGGSCAEVELYTPDAPACPIPPDDDCSAAPSGALPWLLVMVLAWVAVLRRRA